MMNIITKAFLLVVLFVALGAGAGNAQTGMMRGQGQQHMGAGQGYMMDDQGSQPGTPGYMRYGHGQMMGGQGMYHQATPEQLAEYGKVYDKYQPELQELARETWAKRAELNAVLAQKKIDRARADRLANDVGELTAKAYRKQVEMTIDLIEKGFPYYGMGMMGGAGHMMGGGMMHGGMMGGGMMHGGGMMGAPSWAPQQ